MADVKVCYARINLADSVKFTATHLRGYVGYLFIEDTEFHHHMDNPYHYPLIQYKVIQGRPIIIGIQDYAQVLLRKLAGLEKIVGKDAVYPVTSVEISQESLSIGRETRKYRFVTPWIALNEENHHRFLELDYDGKAALLKKILTGNILSMLKGLKIFIDYRLEVSIEAARPFMTKAHGNTFWGFKPEFSANISIPDYLGLGKSVSKGFGTVVGMPA